jgi:uncharacterized protein YndB with AHSA1/START domain
MTELKIEQSIWINASRERVWQAITQPEQMMQWFLANIGKMKQDDDGKLTILMGPMEIDIMRLEKLEALKQVTLCTLPDEIITVTYSLEQENNSTCVKVIMAGFEGFAEETREDRLEQSSAAWEKTLQNLKAYGEGAALPFPKAYVAPLFGYWRDMKETFALERSIWIDAPITRVWQAITDPMQIESWFSPGTPWRMTALEVGGKLYIPDAKTGAETHTQSIEVVEPPYRFVVHTVPDASGKFEKTIHSLREEAGGTRFTITHTGYERLTEEVRWGTMEQNTFGFGKMLQNAKAFVEGKSLPVPGGF